LYYGKKTQSQKDNAAPNPDNSSGSINPESSPSPGTIPTGQEQPSTTDNIGKAYFVQEVSRKVDKMIYAGTTLELGATYYFQDRKGAKFFAKVISQIDQPISEIIQSIHMVTVIKQA